MNAHSPRTGLIAWFASNNVAANLLMFLIIGFGLYAGLTIRKQTTPDLELNVIQVSVPYPGAAPQEVEQAVVVRIEEAVQDVPGIEELNTTAREGLGTARIKVAAGADLNQVMSQLKTRVDAIATFPELTERPVIEKIEPPIPVIFLSVFGDLDEYARKELARNIRDDLMVMPEVNDVEVLGDRDYEISIEVSEETLRRYQLTMTEIAQAVRAQARDIPGGTIETLGGDILLRTQGQVYTGQAYADLTLRTFADGTRLLLGDVATVRDGFVENDGFGRLNGKPNITLRVLAGAQKNELETAALVKSYVADLEKSLPDSVTIKTWVDRSSYLQQRLDMMLTNLLQGALLVFVVLTLFLRLKFALWVMVGIPVTFLGALWLMPHGPWPVTINMISLFGFILVLGIVVDDAIIIGESIYTHVREKGHSITNVVDGAQHVAVAATFGVLTTIAAFAPMLFVGGIAGAFLEAVAVVVTLCLLFSLVESKLILPAHLAHSRFTPVDEEESFAPLRNTPVWHWPGKLIERAQRRTRHGLQWVIERVYSPLLARAMRARGITLALFAAMLIVTLGLFAGGQMRFVLFPDVPSEFSQMTLTMQNGTPTAVRNAVLLDAENALYRVRARYLEESPDGVDPLSVVATFTNPGGGQMIVEMPPAETQTISMDELTRRWREEVGELPGVRTLTFASATNIGGGAPLSFALSGNNVEALEQAAEELAIKLTSYAGVFDVRNSANPGGDEIQLAIRPTAEALGITLTALGTQVRQAFYGEEVQRIQRGTEELKVMVRYPEEQRRSVANLESMLIVTPDGDQVPFSEVADVRYDAAYSVITRLNGKRTVTVSADLDSAVVEPGTVIDDIRDSYLPELLSRYSGVEFDLSGASLEQQEFVRNLTVASLAALFLIYALIAIPLKSYTQPLIIMSVIPFGFVGAVVGHLLLGQAISMFSLFGLIALAGVVVNDSLIMLDFINRARAAGVSAEQAVIDSGRARFRAIVLTSLTTAIGLMPIMLESSTQAQFVIPMAISLSFGILFATTMTLILVPVLYLMQLDFLRWWHSAWLWLTGRSPRHVAAERR